MLISFIMGKNKWGIIEGNKENMQCLIYHILLKKKELVTWS